MFSLVQDRCLVTTHARCFLLCCPAGLVSCHMLFLHYSVSWLRNCRHLSSFFPLPPYPFLMTALSVFGCVCQMFVFPSDPKVVSVSREEHLTCTANSTLIDYPSCFLSPERSRFASMKFPSATSSSACLASATDIARRATRYRTRNGMTGCDSIRKVTPSPSWRCNTPLWLPRKTPPGERSSTSETASFSGTGGSIF